jgi:hypothetical protein
MLQYGLSNNVKVCSLMKSSSGNLFKTNEYKKCGKFCNFYKLTQKN